MVDPVIAADGHTYDRPQIEKWMRQQATNGQHPPTSPQTRESLQDTRLLPNLALRRTIERLTSSGQLDEEIVQEWRAAQEAMMLKTASAKRDQSLAIAPIGTPIDLKIKLSVVSESRPSTDPLLSVDHTPLSELLVDVNAAKGGGGGLFGARWTIGRLLIPKLSLRKALSAVEPSSNQEAAQLLIQDFARDVLPTSLPADELIAAVFPAGNHSESECMTFALGHIVSRLSSTEGGMPEDIRRLAPKPRQIKTVASQELQLMCPVTS
jgi:hypothetical protein